jgi:RHS repeat-associated protein
MNDLGSPTQVRSFSYDHRGFLTSESHPELGTFVLYSDHDVLGNPRRIRRGGFDLAYTFDPAGRLTEVRERGTTRVWKSWDYATGNFQAGQWSNGKLASAVRHNRVLFPGTTSEIEVPVTEDYEYSGVGGRISQVTTTVGVGATEDNTRPVFDYDLVYDPLGNVSSRTYPRCTFNFCSGSSASPLRTVTGTFAEGLLTALPGYASAITYHPNGLVAQVSHTNGVSDVQEKDPTDMARPARLRTSGASEGFDTGVYSWDGAGNVTQMGSHRFVYDLLSRVTEGQVEIPGTGCGEELLLQSGTETGTVTRESCGTVRAEGSYRVGATGNVTLRAGHRVVLGDGFSVASGGRLTVGTDPALDPQGEPKDAGQSYTYDRFGNLLTVTTAKEGASPVTRTIATSSSTNRLTVATYDLSGNVTTWAGRQYLFDPFNMLWQTKPTSGNGVTFLYGPGDERLWTIDWTAGAAASSWVQTWTLRDLDGSPLRQFRNLGENTTAANWSFHRDYVYRGGALLAAHTPQGLHHFHLDHLGSPRLITGANGTTLAQHLYFPFGEEATNPGQDDEALQFTGHERDDLDLGAATTRDLDYQHRRFFSPHLGRFLSTDPLAGHSLVPQAFNLYGYTLGNPVKYTDPRGMWPFFPLGDIPLWDEITVIGELIPLAPYNPLSGVQGLGDLLSGRSSLNSLSAPAPRGSRGSRRPSRSPIAQIFCPPIAQGVSGDISTINPFTSGGGGSYGLNLQYVPGEGLALYGFVTPNDIASVGFDVGGSLTINGAIGSGPWTGDFITAMGTVGSATFGGFGSPSDQLTGGDIGWHGIQGGVTGGIPFGLGATTTTYSKLFDLSFLIPWCQ